MNQLFSTVKNAGKSLVLINEKTINKVINEIAEKAVAQASYILTENQKDLDKMDKTDPKYDRLMLTKERIEGIAGDLKNVAGLPSPLGQTLMETIRPNGMKISKISVPFGVIGIIYEARPNVSFDVFSLCFKSGNACVLKGGSDAHYSNTAIVGIIRECLKEAGINPDICSLLPPDKEYVTALLNAVEFVDLIIPRGSRRLIDFVRENAKVPILETGAGICHTFFDESGDREKGWKIINNAKTRRVSVCNALDCLIIHETRLNDLPILCHSLIDSNVTIYADSQAYPILKDNYPPGLLQEATDLSFGTEFLDYKMSIKTVKDINEAMGHIDKYSSKHSECIISENSDNILLFEKIVDAACVYVNVPTSFTDGAQFGLGAEIGISTQKLHARGPMALQELTSYKWIIKGEGQIRK